jgi:NAD-dependent SIR2 family protein deacetylase
MIVLFSRTCTFSTELQSAMHSKTEEFAQAPKDVGDGAIDAAALLIRNADAILIGAGAGMGVDSGLPDFRGKQGFWEAYPVFHGKSFPEVATPRLFEPSGERGWGFYGHRLNLYRRTEPHAGFSAVLRWAARAPRGYFIFTSNVDGHFQKAGFSEQRVLECHGSIHFLQCARRCHDRVWPVSTLNLIVDENSLVAQPPLPACPKCHGLARPNVLMFDDSDWVSVKYEEQREHYDVWLRQIHGCEVVALEIGAGVAVPTVREECERVANVVVRINPVSNVGRQAQVTITSGALAAIAKIDARLNS